MLAASPWAAGWRPVRLGSPIAGFPACTPCSSSARGAASRTAGVDAGYLRCGLLPHAGRAPRVYRRLAHSRRTGPASRHHPPPTTGTGQHPLGPSTSNAGGRCACLHRGRSDDSSAPVSTVSVRSGVCMWLTVSHLRGLSVARMRPDLRHRQPVCFPCRSTGYRDSPDSIRR